MSLPCQRQSLSSSARQTVLSLSLVVLVCLGFTTCRAFSPSLIRTSGIVRRSSLTEHQATSSRDLRGSRKKKKKQVTRIARAAANAAALYPPPPPKPRVSNLGNLQQLTHAIDEQLVARKTDLRGPPQPQDSISALLDYNEEHSITAQQQSSFSVALVFGKALHDDQVTVEYAARIQSLVEMLLEEDCDLKVVSFCGALSGQNHISTADAGYVFFRHLCASHHVNLDDVDIFIDRTSKDESVALSTFMNHLQPSHIPAWLKCSTDQESSLDDYGVERSQKRIHIQVSLISTGYHLCNLNDIHRRSPGQSLLRPLLKDRSPKNALYGQNDPDDDLWDDDDFHVRKERETTGIVEILWNYRYASYPYLYAKDEAVAFMARAYLLGEELLPLYVNLKGVVNEKEFFQRDNYLVLASIRRSLVTQMEELYKTNPTLKSDLGREINVIMEGVVLSLGRCIDLVRPAGLLLGSVKKSDFTKALRELDRALIQIRTYCDPDAPLRPSEWGKLNVKLTTDDESTHDRLYRQLDMSLRDNDEEEGEDEE